MTRTAPITDMASPARAASYRFPVGVLVLVIAAVAALLASNNWGLVIIPAALVALVADLIACTIRRWWWWLRLAVAAAIGVVVGIALNVRPGWAFHEAFGINPPAGVRDVHIWRHYVGGPGEHVLIIEFTTDGDVVRALTSLRPVQSDSERAETWRAAGAGWSAAFDTFSGPAPTALARRSWMRIKPLESPEVFDFGDVHELGGSAVLFHEPRTGRCVALHVRF